MKHLLVLLALLVAVLLAVGCDRTITGDEEEEVAENSSSNCFDCHDYGIDLGTKVKLAMRQWDNSQHGSGENMRSSGSCAACHTTEGFIEKVTGEDITSGAFNAVGCFACHDPHENGDFRLRTTAAVELGNGATYDRGVSNLCVECHHSRRDVETYVVDGKKMSNHFGPHHSNQSDMLIGENAYEYDGYDYDEDSWHATGVAEGCITCHYDVTSAYEVGGHTFKMENEDGDENTDACNVKACHATYTKIIDFDRVTDYDFDDDGDDTEGVQTEINDLMDELQALLIAAGLLDYIAEDDAWEPDTVVVPDADTLGAVYNWAFVHEEGSHGIHNTRYAAALLISSINYMTTGDPSGVSGDPVGADRVAMRNQPLQTVSSH